MTDIVKARERLEADLRLNNLYRDDDGEVWLKVREIDLRTLLSSEGEAGAEIDRLRNALLGIAETDHYRRYPKQHEDGGVRGQSGLRAVRALTGQHGSYLGDDDVRRLDAAARSLHARACGRET